MVRNTFIGLTFLVLAGCGHYQIDTDYYQQVFGSSEDKKVTTEPATPGAKTAQSFPLETEAASNAKTPIGADAGSDKAPVNTALMGPATASRTSPAPVAGATVKPKPATQKSSRPAAVAKAKSKPAVRTASTPAPTAGANDPAGDRPMSPLATNVEPAPTEEMPSTTDDNTDTGGRTADQKIQVTPMLVKQLRLGMTRDQVRSLLGSPPAEYVAQAPRWEYPYTTSGKGSDISDHVAVVFFDDRVSKIEKRGADDAGPGPESTPAGPAPAAAAKGAGEEEPGWFGRTWDKIWD